MKDTDAGVQEQSGVPEARPAQCFALERAPAPVGRQQPQFPTELPSFPPGTAKTVTWTRLFWSLREPPHFHGASHRTRWAGSGRRCCFWKPERWLVFAKTAFPLPQGNPACRSASSTRQPAPLQSTGAAWRKHETGNPARLERRTTEFQSSGIAVLPATLRIHSDFSASLWYWSQESDTELQPSSLQNGY